MDLDCLQYASFSKQLRQGMPYKTVSHEQHFLKYRFLDICQCAFKESKIMQKHMFESDQKIDRKFN